MRRRKSNAFKEWEVRLRDRARALAAVDGYLKGTTAQYRLEHRLQHKDGSYRWIAHSAPRFRNPR
ncbi:MAG: PAS domain-containing protein [Nitrospiraceae bacterium]